MVLCSICQEQVYSAEELLFQNKVSLLGFILGKKTTLVELFFFCALIEFQWSF